MENDQLTPTPADESAADAWLRAHAALPPLTDDGFTARVLTALPPRRRHAGRGRTWAILAGAAAGVAVAAARLATGHGGAPLVAPSPEEARYALAVFVDPKTLLALGVAAASVAFAYWPALRRHLPI